MKITKHIKLGFVPHRHNSYKPHMIRWQGLLVIALFVFAIQFGLSSRPTDDFKVLGYATNVSVGSLHSLSNAERSGRGLSSYSLNSKLNSAAQSKANHMIANNYWAHTAPDGTTPWYFIGNVGYTYIKAGENLAYGYSTSGGVVNGWMNSPAHKANVLDNDFRDVGYGIADGATFQGGENTVVVAMYGNPTVAAPKPAPAPAATNSSPTSTPAPTPVAAAPVEEIEEVVEEAKENEEAEEETTELGSQFFLSKLDPDEINVNGVFVIPENAGNTVTNLEAVLTGQAHWTLYATMGALFALAVVYFMRHMTAIFQYVKHGEHYVVGHPLLEAGIIYAALWMLMAGTYGVVL